MLDKRIRGPADERRRIRNGREYERREKADGGRTGTLGLRWGWDSAARGYKRPHEWDQGCIPLLSVVPSLDLPPISSRLSFCPSTSGYAPRPLALPHRRRPHPRRRPRRRQPRPRRPRLRRPVPVPVPVPRPAVRVQHDPRAAVVHMCAARLTCIAVLGLRSSPLSCLRHPVCAFGSALLVVEGGRWVASTSGFGCALHARRRRLEYWHE